MNNVDGNSILEEYIDSLAVLPTHMQKNMQLLKELDAKCSSLLEETKSRVYGDFDAKALKESKYVDKQFEEIFKLSEEKVQLGLKCYEDVDKLIRRLDDEMEKFSLILSKERRDVREEVEPLVPSVQTGSGRSGIAHIEEELPREELAAPAVVGGAGVKQQVTSVNNNINAAVISKKEKLKQKKKGREKSPTPVGTVRGRDEDLSSKTEEQPQKRRILLKSTRGHSASTSEVAPPPIATEEIGALVPTTTTITKRKKVPAPSASRPATVPIRPEGETPAPDGSEPLYCICKNISYGQMVACDNPECTGGEWFHFACVGVTEEPKGTWFCPVCAVKLKEK